MNNLFPSSYGYPAGILECACVICDSDLHVWWLTTTNRDLGIHHCAKQSLSIEQTMDIAWGRHSDSQCMHASQFVWFRSLHLIANHCQSGFEPSHANQFLSIKQAMELSWSRNLDFECQCMHCLWFRFLYLVPNHYQLRFESPLCQTTFSPLSRPQILLKTGIQTLGACTIYDTDPYTW